MQLSEGSAPVERRRTARAFGRRAALLAGGVLGPVWLVACAATAAPMTGRTGAGATWRIGTGSTYDAGA